MAHTYEYGDKVRDNYGRTLTVIHQYGNTLSAFGRETRVHVSKVRPVEKEA